MNWGNEGLVPVNGGLVPVNGGLVPVNRGEWGPFWPLGGRGGSLFIGCEFPGNIPPFELFPFIEGGIIPPIWSNVPMATKIELIHSENEISLMQTENEIKYT